MGIYLSPVWHTLLPEYRSEFGYIHNLQDGTTQTAVMAGHPWMLDNNAYTEYFTEDRWLRILEKYQGWASTCLGVVIPDKVGDAKETLLRFGRYHEIPKQYGYPVCFVTQDGIKDTEIPWDDFDCLFVGGRDAHKFDINTARLVTEAGYRKKWTHIGRVNSRKRILRFWYADSWDGTTLKFKPSISNQRKILYAAREAAQLKQQRRLF